MSKRLLLIFGSVVVFSLGASGGIWAQAFLLPYLSSHDMFYAWSFVKEWTERTTVIKETQHITISEDQAIAQVVERGKRSTVAVESSNGVLTVSGSGLAATSDGFIVTVASVVPEGYTPVVYVGEDTEGIQARVLKRDIQKDLAIVKIDQRNLSVASFAPENSWRIGDTIVMVARVKEGIEIVEIAQAGTVRATDESSIRTNILDKPALSGSPVFNMAGQVLGVSTFETGGRLVIIPVSALREFSGF